MCKITCRNAIAIWHITSINRINCTCKFQNKGVNPSLPIPSITFITDEVAIVAATGCSFLIPSRTGLVYFEGELVSQFHIADSDEQSVFAFFEGFQPNATSCNY